MAAADAADGATARSSRDPVTAIGIVAPCCGVAAGTLVVRGIATAGAGADVVRADIALISPALATSVAGAAVSDPVAAASTVDDAATSRGAGSCVMTSAMAPMKARPITAAPTVRTAGVPVDVSSSLSAGLPGRISGVRLAMRNTGIGTPQYAQTSSSSPTIWLQAGQVADGGTVMPENGRMNGRRVGRPRCRCRERYEAPIEGQLRWAGRGCWDWDSL